MLPAPGFHHLHLNSVDPDAAVDFYTRQFPTTSKTSWGGLPALAVAERRLGPVHQGRRPARHLAADRDLALRLACHRHAPDASNSTRAGRTSRCCRSTPRMKAARSSSAATPGRARAACRAGRRRRSPRPRPRACSQPARAASGTCRVPTMPSWNTRATTRPSASTTCTSTRTIRSVPSSGTRQHLNAPVFAGRTSSTPLTEDTCQVPARTRAQLAGARTAKGCSGRRRPRSCSVTWRSPGTCGRATARSWARAGSCTTTSRSASPISTPGWPSCAARASRFLEEPYPLGDTRAVMIEGPSREALELVEVAQ